MAVVHFARNGEPIEGLHAPQDSIILTERGDSFLTGTLGAGSPLGLIELNHFAPYSTLTLTLVGAGGDLDNDGDIDNLDITPFIAALTANDEQAFLGQVPSGNFAAADIDLSGAVNSLDITPFVHMLADSAAGTVPEPLSMVTLVGLGALLLRRGWSPEVARSSRARASWSCGFGRSLQARSCRSESLKVQTRSPSRGTRCC